MKCKKEGCGADLGPDAQFCSDCGTKVTTPTLIKSTICPSCNNFVLEDHKFCLKCGTRVDPALFTDKVCSGTKKDGGKCNTVLASGANFCLSCGISTLQADVTAVSREVMVASQKDHISVTISDSTERLDEEKRNSSRSGSGSNSSEIWVPPAIKMVHSEQSDDVNTSDQSEIINAENNGQLTLNDNSPCPEETEINSSDQIDVTAVSREVMVASQKDHISVPITDSTERLDDGTGNSSRPCSNSPEIWVPSYIIRILSEQNDDVNTSDQSAILNAENNEQLTLNDNSPCPEETEINPSGQIELVGVQLSENDDRSKDGMTSTGSHQEVPMSSDSESVFTKKKNLELISSEDDIKENNGKQLKRKAKEKEKAETTKKEEETKLLEEINLTDKLTNETHVQNTQDIKEKQKKESSVDQQTEENEDKPNDSTELDKKEDKPNDSTELDKKEDKPNDSTELDKGREKITQDELQAIEREKDIKEQPKKESSVDQQTEEKEDKPNDSTELDKKEDKPNNSTELDKKEDKPSDSTKLNKKEDKPKDSTKLDKKDDKPKDSTELDKETLQQKMAKSGTNKRLDGKSEKERTSSDANFEVTFHAIMHSSIYNDNCTAYVRFPLNILGGWTSRKHEMYPIRKLEDDSFEVEGLVSIPRGHLSTAIMFRYYVVRGDTQWEEFIYNQQNNMRTLYVIPNDIKLYDGRFHQYDGVIRVKEAKEGCTYLYYHYTGQEDSRYRKELHKDAVLSADAFLPVWQTVIKPSSGCSGEEMIMRIQSVLKGLQKTYQILNITDDKFLQPFREALISRFDTLWQEFVNKKDYCREDRIKIMTNALTVIYLVNEHSLTLSRDYGSVLYRALLPECEKKGNKYMEIIKEVFPQTFQMLPRHLLDFAESGIKIASPNWIFCMPMIHFLFNQCCPGEKPPDTVNHDSPIPEWWGIAKKENYEFDLKEFKKKPIERLLLKEILVILSPYFEVDYLLPRTLMACLTLEQLPIVVRSGLIPPDITLASLCFHVRKESQIFKNSDKEMVIIACLTSVNSKFINLKEDAERSTEVLSCAWKSYLIAADVIKYMHERSGKNLTDNVMSLALESFLISLHVYYTTYNMLTETTGEQKIMEDYGRVLDSVRSSTRYWLNNKIRCCQHEALLACLKSWNRVLNVAVPEGVIKDEFIKFIADTIYESLIDKNFEKEEVVKVYRENQKFFCNAMLNILTKYA